MTEAARRYRVRDVLGAGAFGTVYRADAMGSGDFTRPVAVKLLHRQFASEEPLVQRLRDEARMLARLKHRAIVRVDDLVQMEGSWAIVMELVDGVDLQRISAYRPLPPGPAAEVVQEVASALRVAFEQQDEDGHPLHLLHRDIKPSNLALTPTGEVRVLDFGVARAEIPGRESETLSALLGTPAYMAPECFDDGPGHASDVFALGATFYELLTGHMLGRTSVDPERHQARVEEAMGELPAEVGDHPELTALLRSMLAYRPEERPTAREVERGLRDLRPGLGEPWLSDWAPEVVADVLAQVGPHDDRLAGTLLVEGSSETFALGTLGDVSTRPPARRWTTLLLVGAVVVALAALLVIAVGVGGIGMYLWRPAPVVQPEPAPAPEPVVSTEPLSPPAPAPVEPSSEPSAEPAPEPSGEPLSEPAIEPTPETPSAAAPAPEPPTAPAPTPEPEAVATPLPKPRTGPPPVPPAVVPEPEPAPAPPRARTAEVAVDGPVERVVLVAGETRHPVPGDVPPGTYNIEATFPGRPPAPAGQVTVHEGEAVTLECKAGFFLCQPR